MRVLRDRCFARSVDAERFAESQAGIYGRSAVTVIPLEPDNPEWHRRENRPCYYRAVVRIDASRGSLATIGSLLRGARRSA